MTDRERLLAELRGDPLRSRDELRERMESLAARPRQHRRVDNVTIHETTPNVGVARPLSKAQNDGLKAVDLISYPAPNRRSGTTLYDCSDGDPHRFGRVLHD